MKKWFILLLILLPLSLQAQETEEQIQQIEQPQKTRENFFAAPLFETLFYSRDGIAAGGGVAVGYGNGIAYGLRLLFTGDNEDIVITEIQFCLRWYFIEKNTDTGPFVQFNGGPVMYGDGKAEVSGYGNMSIGATAGWRFPLLELFFVEPAVRLGFPYIFGVGVAGGVRF